MPQAMQRLNVDSSARSAAVTGGKPSASYALRKAAMPEAPPNTRLSSDFNMATVSSSQAFKRGGTASH